MKILNKKQFKFLLIIFFAVFSLLVNFKIADAGFCSLVPSAGNITLPVNSTTLTWSNGGGSVQGTYAELLSSALQSEPWPGYKFPATGGSQSMTSLVAGHHSYRIRCDYFGEPPMESVASVYVNHRVTLTASPSSMTLPANSTTLTWSMTNGSDSRNLPTSCTASASPANASWTGSKGTAATNSQVVTNLVVGTNNFTITCPKSGLATSVSTVAVTVTAPIPTTPTGLTTTAVIAACGTGRINISWNASSGATSYQLRDGATQIYSGSATSFAHTGLAAGSSHSYSVRATNATGSSAYSSPATPGTAPALCAVPLPDLTASTPPENSATVGVPQTFTSTISNNGTASTGGSFTNMFQTSTSSDGSSGVVDYPVSPAMSALAAGGSAGTSKSITFSGAGTIYVRACADKSSAADVDGVIDESDENNNCSMSTPWKAVTVGSAPEPIPIVSISANPTNGTVNAVNPALTWSATNSPTSCTASGDWSGSKPVSGANISQGVLTTIRTYTYTLVCSNAAGDSVPQSAIVIVSGGGAVLTASSTSIYSGDSITLTWSCPVADTSALGTNFNTSGAAFGTISIMPAATTTFVLTCGPSGATAQVTVTVRKKPIYQEQ